MGLLVGREHELDDLDEWCRSRKAELVCVYGRRRVGKTHLVENAFPGRLAFSVTGSEDRRTATQMRVFTRALRRFGAQAVAGVRDWFDAFDCLRDLLERGDVRRAIHDRRVVFLDEFPWMAGRHSDFLAAFADFWNSWASKQDDLMVIICGSATSWIVRNIFENTGSMYNRITRRLYVAPFDLCKTERMIECLGLGWSRSTILQAYLVFGGLPYYLDMLDRRLSLAQNIDALCFGAHAPLRDETPHLMEATLSGSPMYPSILRLLAQRKMGMHRTELAKRVGSNGSSLKRALDDLERCGYIRRYTNPYERYRPTIYQLVDPFLLFSLRFMDEAPLEGWTGVEGSPAYYAWRGNAFEIVALGHIPQIKRALGIAAVQTTCFPWSSVESTPGAQVDLVMERADGVTDLCEMKCTDDPFVATRETVEGLRRKRSVFRKECGTRNAVHLVLVCAPKLREGRRPEDVAAVADAAVALEILPNAKVAAAAIPGCAIRFVAAKDAKAQVEKAVAIDPSQFGGEAPADDFYYDAE